MKTLACLLMLSLACGCADPSPAPQPAAPTLTSWSPTGSAQKAIQTFVEAVCKQGGPDFVAPTDRVAVFDNDGTLWCEKPLYFQLVWALEAIKAAVASDATLTKDPLIKAIAEGDKQALKEADLMDVVRAILPFHANLAPAEMQRVAAQWLADTDHPRFKRPYGELVYQPMLELLDYLRAHEFRVFIVTGGGIDFVRGISESAYKVAREDVVGSSLVYEWLPETESVGRKAKLGSIDDKTGKPPNIALHIGRRPILAAGNSDGDLQMLQYTDAGKGPSLQLLVHHDDAEREYDYDHGTEAALVEAAKRGWTVVSIKTDFVTVFPKKK